MVRFRVEHAWHQGAVYLWIIETRGGKNFIGKPIDIEFTEIDECANLPEPTFKLTSAQAKEWIPEIKKSLAGYTLFDDKEDYETAKRVEKAMQAHIDSLKLVVERAVK